MKPNSGSSANADGVAAKAANAKPNTEPLCNPAHATTKRLKERLPLDNRLTLRMNRISVNANASQSLCDLRSIAQALRFAGVLPATALAPRAGLAEPAG